MLMTLANAGGGKSSVVGSIVKYCCGCVSVVAEICMVVTAHLQENGRPVPALTLPWR